MKKKKTITCNEISMKMSELCQELNVSPYEWIHLDDFTPFYTYFNTEIPKDQISIEETALTRNTWVYSVCINDGKNFIHHVFKLYLDQEEAQGEYLN